jgi:predicted NBD/HSP70 family sugar kinase
VSQAGSLQSLRQHNLLRVVDALRAAGAASRADIARNTGLSRTTVSTLVADLHVRGLVVESAAEAPPARAGQLGRPPILLSLDASAAAGVGIDFDHDRVRVAVSDLSRTVLAEAIASFDVDRDATASVEQAGRLVDEVLEEAGLARDRVLGAGVAIAGPVDQETGVVRESSILPGWSGRNAAALLGERLAMPVQVDNDANLGALAEVTFGAAVGARYAVYVSISSGIGAGIVVEGRPYRGARGIAGEIGHLLMDPDGRICRCGNRGCLETVASGPALLDLMRASRGEAFSLDQVLDLAAAGDSGCRRAIADAGRNVGRALASVVSILGPEVVVVGGELSRAGDDLLDPLAEAIHRFALPAATQELAVVRGALGDRANLLGALALVVTQSDHAVAARLVQAVDPAQPVEA